MFTSLGRSGPWIVYGIIQYDEFDTSPPYKTLTRQWSLYQNVLQHTRENENSPTWESDITHKNWKLMFKKHKRQYLPMKKMYVKITFIS